MKLQNFYFSLIFSLLFVIPCIGQFPQATQRRSSNFNFEANLASNNIMRSRDVLQEVINQGKNNEIAIVDIEGEPYFEKRFQKGDLMYKDSLKIGEYLMRYNAFTDEIEVNEPTGTNVLNKADYLRIIMNGEKYVPLNYIDDSGEIKKGFFVQLGEESVTGFFLRKFKTVRQAQEAKTSFHKAAPPTFVDHESYFLKFGTEAPLEIKLKKSKVLKSFPQHADAIKKYVTKEKLDLETEAGVIRLVNFYNTL